MMRRHIGFVVTRLTFGIFAAALAVFLPLPARADPFVVSPLLPVTVSGPTSLTEGQNNVLYTFTVTNNTGDALILDMALATIDYAGFVDPTDQIVFSGANGSNGSQGYAATIANGGTGTFVYSVDTGSADFPSDGDFGVDDFNFAVEYSSITGAPNTPTIQASGPLLLLLDGAFAGNVDPAERATLIGCVTTPAPCTNGPGDFLYPLSLNPGFNIYGGAAEITVTVNDPEPASLAVFGSALVGLVAMRRRKRKTV
jgi:hypothetical protein